VVAVNDLSFTVQPGRVTGFLGPNGAGKSTTLRILLGLSQPTAGDAMIEGHRYADLPSPATRVGALLDASAAHPARSARDHLRVLAVGAGLPTARIDAVLDMVGLTSVAGRKLKGYSLGMSQRLGIAAAMLGDPRVLILDEPANGLDPEGIQWLRGFLRALADEGRTVLVSSHLLSEMQVMADDVVVVAAGRLVRQGSVHDVVQSVSGNRVRVVTPDGARLSELLTARGARVDAATDGALLVSGVDRQTVSQIALAARIELHELGVESSDLQQAFLKLTSGLAEIR
jgi:ABC-2 type transport system ATP-binding protein